MIGGRGESFQFEKSQYFLNHFYPNCVTQNWSDQNYSKRKKNITIAHDFVNEHQYFLPQGETQSEI